MRTGSSDDLSTSDVSGRTDSPSVPAPHRRIAESHTGSSIELFHVSSQDLTPKMPNCWATDRNSSASSSYQIQLLLRFTHLSLEFVQAIQIAHINNLQLRLDFVERPGKQLLGLYVKLIAMTD